MFVVTNREIKNPNRHQGLDVFGAHPNPKGPNELRIVEVIKEGNAYVTEPVPDRLTLKEARALKRSFRLDIDERQVRHGSLRVACQLMRQAMQQQRHVLVYVHGYNNDMTDVVKTVEDIEKLYGVIVLPFSWPANGGGAVSGTTAYPNDKQDARASMDALNRFLDKLQFFHTKLVQARKDELWQQADSEFPDNPSGAQEHFAELLHDDCKVNLSMLCHSMGNYLLKYALRPTKAASKQLIFDNICLAAADANNAAHQVWVEQLQVRNRLYVLINENDFALEWSRRKPGDEQWPRLGHYLKNLTARNVRYIDVTQAKAVDNAHNYFTGKTVQRNAAMRTLFSLALEGGRADDGLAYAADVNAYRAQCPALAPASASSGNHLRCRVAPCAADPAARELEPDHDPVPGRRQRQPEHDRQSDAAGDDHRQRWPEGAVGEQDQWQKAADRRQRGGDDVAGAAEHGINDGRDLVGSRERVGADRRQHDDARQFPRTTAVEPD